MFELFTAALDGTQHVFAEELSIGIALLDAFAVQLGRQVRDAVEEELADDGAFVCLLDPYVVDNLLEKHHTDLVFVWV